MHPTLRAWLGQLREAVAKQPPVGNAQLLEQLIASHEEADAEIARLTDRIEKEFAITDRAKARARELEATLAEERVRAEAAERRVCELIPALDVAQDEAGACDVMELEIRRLQRDLAAKEAENGKLRDAAEFYLKERPCFGIGTGMGCCANPLGNRPAARCVHLSDDPEEYCFSGRFMEALGRGEVRERSEPVGM